MDAGIFRPREAERRRRSGATLTERGNAGAEKGKSIKAFASEFRITERWDRRSLKRGCRGTRCGSPLLYLVDSVYGPAFRLIAYGAVRCRRLPGYG